MPRSRTGGPRRRRLWHQRDGGGCPCPVCEGQFVLPSAVPVNREILDPELLTWNIAGF
jgi:hypothetical protein